MRRLLLFLLLLPLALWAADITGNWNFSVDLDAGSGNPSFTFQQDGEKLTGHYSGQLGEADLTGTVRGDDIEFTFTVKGDQGESTATFTGKISGDTMKGKAVYTNFGSGTFAARRAR
ncbi:MAG: hypothetical protein HY236_01690 [Acidobacteria bacterium]|nr:hypothetical protein [Acidobacteriota bacterium]